MSTKSTLCTVLMVRTRLILKGLLFLALTTFVVKLSHAATVSWRASAGRIEGYGSDEIRIELFGYVEMSRWDVLVHVRGPMFGYIDNGEFYLNQYDRKTTWVGDDNVTFVLALYGELLSADTIKTATKVPQTFFGATYHYDGLAIDDPSDFYLGFMTPESKTADGIPRYGWYHLAIADDLSGITLLDSGVGLYGESVYVGIGVTPEPSSAILLLLGCAGLALKRHRA